MAIGEEEWKQRYCSLLAHYDMLIKVIETLTPPNSVNEVFHVWYEEGKKDGK
jgi:hypothetical protein